LPFLIGLAVADRDFNSRLALLDILAIERNELGATERTGKAQHSSKARSRRPFNPSPVPSAMEMMRSAVAGAFLRAAIPRLRRMPRTVAFTRSSSRTFTSERYFLD
jgi:hypothetical protein